MTEKLNSSNLRQNPRNVNELVNELTLFDDDLMSRVFDKNIKATELLLRIILGKKVKVISVTGQNEMKNHQVGRRNITPANLMVFHFILPCHADNLNLFAKNDTEQQFRCFDVFIKHPAHQIVIK